MTAVPGPRAGFEWAAVNVRFRRAERLRIRKDDVSDRSAVPLFDPVAEPDVSAQRFMAMLDADTSFEADRQVGTPRNGCLTKAVSGRFQTPTECRAGWLCGDDCDTAALSTTFMFARARPRSEPADYATRK